jgi:DNA modification methylase
MDIGIHVGDCLEVLRTWPDACVDCCVTSPPYWGLRDYSVEGQLGLEPTLEEYIAKMVAVFAEVRRVLKPTGTLFLNLGDSYTGGKGGGAKGDEHGQMHKGARIVPNGLKPKDLCMIPARVALALQADGWWLRSDIIWHKPNPMPESCTDRPTSAHEHIFLLTKTPGTRNYGDTRNARNVWTIATKPYKGAHFATFPPEIPRRCILAGCPECGIVLDPFFGSGTVGMVATELGRQWVGIELNPEYAEDARIRTAQRGLFSEVSA